MGIFVDIKKYKQMNMIWYNSYGRIFFLVKSLTWTIVMIIEQLANVALANDNPYNVFIRGKKGGLGLSDKRKICEFLFFYYKCRKVQTDDSLDSWMRPMIETCKINSPVAAMRAPRELYPSLTSSTEQRRTSYFILKIIIATSSQEMLTYHPLAAVVI